MHIFQYYGVIQKAQLVTHILYFLSFEEKVPSNKHQYETYKKSGENASFDPFLCKAFKKKFFF